MMIGSNQPGAEFIWAGDFKDRNINAILWHWFHPVTYGDLAGLSEQQLREAGLDDGMVSAVRGELNKRGLELAAVPLALAA